MRRLHRRVSIALPWVVSALAVVVGTWLIDVDLWRCDRVRLLAVFAPAVVLTGANAWLWLRPMRGGHRWLWWPWALAVGQALTIDWLVPWSERLDRHALFFMPISLPLCAALATFAGSLRRARGSTNERSLREVALRTLVASGTLILLARFSDATAAAHHFHGGAILSDLAARSTMRSSGLRVLCHALVAVLVPCVWRLHADRPRAAAMLLPMRLVGLFALGLLMLDALELAAASSYERCAWRAIDGHAAAPDALSHLDLLATVSELIALGLVSSALFVGVLSAAFAARSSRSALRVGWPSGWPLVAVIALSPSSSLAPAPDGPMQAPASPASLGASDDFEPLIRASDDREELDPLDFSGTATGIGLLTARGEVQTAGGRLSVRRVPVGDFEYPGRPTEWLTAELLVDRRATLAQLMDAAHALRAFEEVAVGFRVRPELDASPRARARWGFLELASRATAGRRIALVEPQACRELIEVAGARYADCVDEQGQHALVLRDPGQLTIEQWLDTHSELDDWIAIEVTRADLVLPFSDELLWPHDPPPRTHQLGQSWPLSLFGGLAAVLVALVARRRPAPAWLASSTLFDLPRGRASHAESPYRSANHPDADLEPLTDVGPLARSWVATSLWLGSAWALAHLAAWLDR